MTENVLMLEHVLTNLIKFKLIVNIMNPFLPITTIEDIKYQSLTMNDSRLITVITNQIKPCSIASIKYCFQFHCSICAKQGHQFDGYLKFLTTNMRQV